MPRLTLEQTASLQDDLKDGVSTPTLCARYDVSEATVSRHRASVGQSQHRTHDDVVEMRDLYYGQKVAVALIAGHMGCSEATVYRALREDAGDGYPTKPRLHARKLDADNAARAQAMRDAGMPVREIAKMMWVTPATIYRRTESPPKATEDPG